MNNCLHVYLVSLFTLGLFLPLYGNYHKTSYEPYKPEKAESHAVRNLTKIGLGVGLCIGAGITGRYTFNAYNHCLSNVSPGEKGYATTLWQWWRGNAHANGTGTGHDILKKYGITVGWGCLTLVLAASGARLTAQGLDLKKLFHEKDNH